VRKQSWLGMPNIFISSGTVFAGIAGNDSGLCFGLGQFVHSRYQLSLCSNTWNLKGVIIRSHLMYNTQLSHM
jgi:hypothetical protein